MDQGQGGGKGEGEKSGRTGEEKGGEAREGMSRGPSPDEWLTKIWYSPMMEYYLATKRNEEY